MSLASALRECLVDLSDTFLDPSKHDILDGFASASEPKQQATPDS
jgi:hypothetical protein